MYCITSAFWRLQSLIYYPGIDPGVPASMAQWSSDLGATLHYMAGLFGRAWVRLPDWYGRAWESGPCPLAVRLTPVPPAC